MKYRSDVDGLRAVAVLPVVAFHYAIYVPVFGVMIAPGGFVGVDVFFVISGFLITRIIYDDIHAGTYSIADFYNRRVRRIFPALFAMYVFCAIAAFFCNFPSETSNIAKSIVSSIFFVSNLFFYSSTGYFDQNEANPLLHTWSLSVEEQFYLFLPLLVFGIRNLRYRTQVSVLLAVAIASFFYAVWKVSAEPMAAFFLLPSRGWELLAGSLLAIVRPKQIGRWQAEVISLGGLASILATVWLISPKTPFPGLAAVPPCLGAAAILYAGATTWTGRLLASPPLRFVGLISYSLYLWHWPVFVFYRLYQPYANNREKLALAAVAIFLAFISWRFVERPFREKPFRFDTKRTLAASAAVMGIVAIVMIFIGPASEKFWDLPPNVERTLAYDKYDRVGPFRSGTCFTSPSDKPDAFRKDECLALKRDKKNFLVLGDSHAAHLWWGLQATYPEVNFLQATAASCRPVLENSDRPYCHTLMHFIFEQFLPNNHLDGIIISARWTSEHAEGLKKTINTLRPYADRIIVFGPIVEYRQWLPRLLALALSRGLSPPEFAAQYLRSEQEQIDRFFAAQTAKDGAEYISVYRAICHPDCAVWADGVPMQFDDSHLTRQGSAYVASRIRQKLFP